MNTVVIAIISVTAIGLVGSTLLAIAGKLMYVKIDERIARVRACLPGINCSACECSGCDGYAAAVVEGKLPLNRCAPGGKDLAAKIGEILGVGVGEGAVEHIAVVHCCGDAETSRNKMEYAGIRTCAAVKQLFGGQTACTFGCLGYGDCAAVCPSNAICIEKNLARIDARRCTGCGLCVKACPKGILSVETKPVGASVLCRNTEKGGALKDKCSMGCIGCMKCVKECPSEAIVVKDSLAVIDPAKCDGCHKCVECCVKKCIA